MRQRTFQHGRFGFRFASLSFVLTFLSGLSHAQETEAPEEAPKAESETETPGDSEPSTEEESESEEASEEEPVQAEAEKEKPKLILAPQVTDKTLSQLGEESRVQNEQTRAAREAKKAADEKAQEKAALDAEKERFRAMPDEDERAGYIPGYKKGSGLSLPPSAPVYQAAPGGFSTPYHAPAPDDNWAFKFQGYASASLRLTTGSREDPAENQHTTTIQTEPRIPDFFGAFGGTNATPGGWVDLHFQYGNATVESHVTLTTWKQGRAAAYPDIRSQNWLDQAYLLFRLPVHEKVDINWTVGAFRNQYGGLGQYGAGQYNTVIIGQTNGVGETLALKYRMTPKTTLTLEHGLMGKLGKVPFGVGPSAFDPAAQPTDPSPWINHAHIGLSRDGEIPWVLALHYMSNWSQDERDQFDNPGTYFIDERIRPDGRMSIYGAEAKMLTNRFGRLSAAMAYAKLRDAALLEGMGYFGAVSGEEVTKRFLGQLGYGTGSMLAGGIEYEISWARLMHHPQPFWGEGPDFVTTVFSNMALVHSDDPGEDGKKMLKFGGEVTYKFSPWVGISGRYDHVIPNSLDPEETFDVISPKLLFKSQWITHEQVTVSYTRWFYGENTHAEFPFELPRNELDDQMFAIHFGMWW